ncbi:MAG: RdgB/HAM1 family non-canonical purine NTP pyrophosphatase [Alphaproteobacteria bacterium]|jgi:XTP/dITP diphosphohydrolase
MARRFTENRLVIASHNTGKVREMAELMAPLGVAVVSAGELGLPEPVEDGDSFVANAELKARAAAAGSGLPALADDSGIAVTALGGAPGIHSARYAERPDTGARDFAWGMQRLNADLGADADRSAAFVSALSLCWPDGHCESFEGRVSGTLVWPPRGDNGFGYDAMFLPDGKPLTFGEMEPAAKHAISHRAVAFRQLIDACFAARD